MTPMRITQYRNLRRTVPSRQLEWAIILVALAGMIWIAAMTYRQVRFDRELAVAAVVRTNEARVQGFEQFVLRTIETADLATRHIEANSKLIENGRVTVANEPVLRSPVIDSFVIRTPSHRAIRAGSDLIDDATIRELDALVEVATLDLTITPPLRLADGSLKLAAIRKFEAGRGYVAVLMNPARFTDFAQTIPFAKDDLVSLIGLDGVTRARRTGSELSTGEHVSGLVMERQRADPNGTYIGPSVLDQIPRVFSHRRLETYQLFATSGAPVTLIDGRVAPRRQFQIVAALAGIFAIASAAGAIIYFNRKRHQRLIELEDANARLTEAQRIGSIGDWDYYPATDQLYWSDSLREMYGRTPDESLSKLEDAGRHVSPEDKLMISQEIQKIIRSGEPSSWEFVATLGDGSNGYRRVMAVPIKDKEGRVIGVHGTDQDINNLVQARQMERRLSEIARLESVNSLAATLAHELNQPLGVTANYLGAVERLIEDGGSQSKIRKYLKASHDQIHHMSAIIDGARDLVTPGKSEIEEVSLHDAIESVMVLLRGHIGRSVNYKSEIAGNVAHIWTNGAQLKQVLFNLAKNGLEAVPQKREPQLFFRAVRAQDGRAARIDVVDNGSGLTGEGDPFAALNTTKMTGLGLGLSLARTIVEAHEGKIWIESTDVSGTVVSFTIGDLH